MMLYQSPEYLAALWRQRLDSGQEAGHSTLLPLGQDTLHPDSGFILLALSRIVRRSGGRQAPILCAGGDGDFWLLTLMLWRRRSSDSGRNRSIPVYGGGDGGTYAAHLNIVQPGGEHLYSELLSPGHLWLTNPVALPGSERSDVEFVPFALNQHDSQRSERSENFYERLESFLVLVTVLALLLTAWAFL